MPVFEYDFTGMIGVAIYVPLATFYLWQLYFSLKDEVWRLNHRTVFHICSVLFVLLDLGYLAQVWQFDTITLGAFVCHQTALFFNYVAFNCVVHYWAQTLNLLETSIQTITMVTLTLVAMQFVLTVMFIAVNILYGVNCNDSNELCRRIDVAELSSDAFILSLLSFVISSLGIRLQFRLGFNNNNTKVLLKLNVIVASCAFFYIVRAGFTSYVIYIQFLNDHTAFGNFASVQFWWFLTTMWVPLLIPSLMMMYLMRPKKSYLCWDLPNYIKEEVIIENMSNSQSFSSTESSFFNQDNSSNRIQSTNRSTTTGRQSLLSKSSGIRMDSRDDYDIGNSSRKISFDLATYINQERKDQNSSDSDISFFNKPVYGSPINIARSNSPNRNTLTTVLVGIDSDSPTMNPMNSKHVSNNSNFPL